MPIRPERLAGDGPCRGPAPVATNGRGTDESEEGGRDGAVKDRDRGHITRLHIASKPDRWSVWKGPVTQMGDVASSYRLVAFHDARRRLLRYGDVIRTLSPRTHP